MPRRVKWASSRMGEGGLKLALVLAVALLPGCYAGRFKRMDQSIADLSQRADSLAAQQARTRDDLAQTRKLVADHEQTMRSLRAGTETSAQDLQGRLEQIESRLDDQGHQIDDLSGRAHTRASVIGPPAGVVPADTTRPTPVTAPPVKGAPGATSPKSPPAGTSSTGPGAVRVDPTAEYDQAVLDFTQGRFPRSLDEFRAFVNAHGATDLADNAQYGVGESFYAQGLYDSAAVAYRGVVDRWPDGDKVPAALYKLGIAYQKTNHSPEARATFQMLATKYPRTGEARLAQERLKEMDQR
jgi:tol-pal system protein YbgF